MIPCLALIISSGSMLAVILQTGARRLGVFVMFRSRRKWKLPFIGQFYKARHNVHAALHPVAIPQKQVSSSDPLLSSVIDCLSSMCEALGPHLQYHKLTTMTMEVSYISPLCPLQNFESLAVSKGGVLS